MRCIDLLLKTLLHNHLTSQRATAFSRRREFNNSYNMVVVHVAAHIICDRARWIAKQTFSQRWWRRLSNIFSARVVPHYFPFHSRSMMGCIIGAFHTTLKMCAVCNNAHVREIGVLRRASWITDSPVKANMLLKCVVDKRTRDGGYRESICKNGAAFS